MLYIAFVQNTLPNIHMTFLQKKPLDQYIIFSTYFAVERDENSIGGRAYCYLAGPQVADRGTANIVG